jgi:hypothetical protein
MTIWLSAVAECNRDPTKRDEAEAEQLRAEIGLSGGTTS